MTGQELRIEILQSVVDQQPVLESENNDINDYQSESISNNENSIITSENNIECESEVITQNDSENNSELVSEATEDPGVKMSDEITNNSININCNGVIDEDPEHSNILNSPINNELPSSDVFNINTESEVSYNTEVEPNTQAIESVTGSSREDSTNSNVLCQSVSTDLENNNTVSTTDKTNSEYSVSENTYETNFELNNLSSVDSNNKINDIETPYNSTDLTAQSSNNVIDDQNKLEDFESNTDKIDKQDSNNMTIDTAESGIEIPNNNGDNEHYMEGNFIAETNELSAEMDTDSYEMAKVPVDSDSIVNSSEKIGESDVEQQESTGIEESMEMTIHDSDQVKERSEMSESPQLPTPSIAALPSVLTPPTIEDNSAIENNIDCPDNSSQADCSETGNGESKVSGGQGNVGIEEFNWDSVRCVYCDSLVIENEPKLLPCLHSACHKCVSHEASQPAMKDEDIVPGM